MGHVYVLKYVQYLKICMVSLAAEFVISCGVDH